MREVKFRVWNMDTQMFLKDFEFPCGHIAPMIRINTGELTQVDLVGNIDGGIDDQYNQLWGNNQLSQFTGFKDARGIDIYEGDIVRLYHDEAYSPIPESFNGEIKFMEGCWYVDSNTMAFLVFQEIAEWEVIGNIYENANLLKP